MKVIIRVRMMKVIVRVWLIKGDGEVVLKVDFKKTCQLWS